MKNLTAVLAAAVLAACALTACASPGRTARTPAPAAPAAPPASSAQSSQETPPSGEISRDEALAIALANASVPEADAYNVKVERDGDNGIPLWDIEFETEYGDYDFEVALSGGRIVGADYEVDDEWLDRLGRQPRHRRRGQSHPAKQSPRRRGRGHRPAGGAQRRPPPLRGRSLRRRHEVRV